MVCKQISSGLLKFFYQHNIHLQIIYIFNIVKRKYETLIHIPGYGERRCDSLAISWLVVTKNSISERAVSLQPFLLAQGDMGMREPHSLLVMYVSVERGRLATMIGTEE